jgi:DNA-binding PadR family transcriptional regulator
MGLRSFKRTSKRVLSVLYDFNKSGAVDFLERPATVADITRKLGDKDTEEDIFAAVKNLESAGLADLDREDNGPSASVRLTEKGRICIERKFEELDNILRDVHKGKSLAKKAGQ